MLREIGQPTAAQHLLHMLYDRYELGLDTSEGLYAREADEAGTIFEGHIKWRWGTALSCSGQGTLIYSATLLPQYW